MQEIVGQILNEKFEYKNGSLEFSCGKIEHTVSVGKNCEGSFSIVLAQENAAEYMTGYVTASDPRMECSTYEFAGSQVDISYCFHSEHMEEGEVTKGELYVVSNLGEYYLPYVISVEHSVPESSVGPVKNLFHFTNLAKSNIKEALRLFRSPEFAAVIRKEDSHVHLLYQGLSSGVNELQCMDEFLCAVNKKSRVEFVPMERKLELENPSGVAQLVLPILRNGWGYTSLQVSCEGEFIFTEKELLTEDDFLGERCSLPVYIDSQALHAGRNLGCVVLRNPYVRLQIPVEVRVKRKAIPKERKEYKRNVVALMEFYQAFRLKKIGMATWYKESEKIIEKMTLADERNVAVRLFQAQLLLTRNRFNEAEWILTHVQELLANQENPVLEGYYYYLMTLLKREEEYTRRVASHVEKMYKRQGEYWQLAWLQLFLSEELSRSATAKWVFLEQQFVRGCISPVLYMEALQLLNQNPTLLRKLGEYELQVLYFGFRKEALSPEVLEQIYYLSERVKGYSELLYKILAHYYELTRDVRILKNICTLLIKGGLVNNDHFLWFERGLREEVRITNLYEYYMSALDVTRDMELPKTVLMYFSYQNNLDYVHTAYLYSYVLKNREKFPELFESYEPKMREFVKEQLKKEHVSRYLAPLYQHFLNSDIVDMKNAAGVARIIFAHDIQVEREDIRNVIVYQPDNTFGTVYPLIESSVWVSLYGNDCVILFEDGEGNRLAAGVPYTTERLMRAGKYIHLVAGYVPSDLEFDIFAYGYGKERNEEIGDSLARWLRLKDAPNVSLRIRREVTLSALKFYYENDQKSLLTAYLEALQGDFLRKKERADVIQYMILVGLDELAYSWVCRYGDGGVEPKCMAQLLGAVIRRKQYAYDDVLVNYAMRNFARGKTNATVTEYLIQHYRGMSRFMRGIWKQAKSYGIAVKTLSERLLVQHLYTHSHVGDMAAVVKDYVAQQPDMDILVAYLMQKSYDLFVEEQLVDGYIFEKIGELQQEGVRLSKICKLAYLKYYADNKADIREQDKGVISAFLTELMEQGIHLNCFLEFKELGPDSLAVYDKTIVEYRAKPGSSVKIHYQITSEEAAEEEYIMENMIQAYGGVFFKEFVLFFGESLQYYIVEDDGVEGQLTESGSRQKSDMSVTERTSVYHMINDIVISKTLQDYDTFDVMLEELYKTCFYNDNLFQLKKEK
ncbi:MAG: hypothetical protein IJZ82_08950 [Lachnospiraceae bacterium]|nr:hypothetical protein [Lachnospiraceae bacterium]